MKAIVCIGYGDPESLELQEIPVPVPGPGELLVRVATSSVNYPDILTIQGRYQVKHEPPFVPGSEAAGWIAALGPEVSGFAIGDRVAVLTRVGAFAEQVIARAATAIKLP